MTHTCEYNITRAGKRTRCQRSRPAITLTLQHATTGVLERKFFCSYEHAAWWLAAFATAQPILAPSTPDKPRGKKITAAEMAEKMKTFVEARDRELESKTSNE